MGHAAAWLYPVLTVVVVGNVVLRYVFNLGMIELEEVQWHLYASAFLLGYAWTYKHDGHVRVDVFSHRFSARTKAWVEVFGCAFLLLPFVLITTYFAFDFFRASWALRETSDIPSGLPARYVIKFILFLALAMLSLQGVSQLLKNVLVLIGAHTPDRTDGAALD